MSRAHFETVNDYLAAQRPEARAVLRQVRAVLKKALPQAREVISDQIPAYQLPGIGRPVIYFAGFKGHYSIYPVTRLPKKVATSLAPYKVSVGTAQFSYDRKVPVRLIASVARARAAEARGG